MTIISMIYLTVSVRSYHQPHGGGIVEAVLSNLNRYRPWFYAAAVYNAVWGAFVSFAPNAYFDWLKMTRPNYPALFQCIGMMVGVYAIAYWLIAKDPKRYGALVFTGLLGKIFGPLGFLYSAAVGILPWSFGVVNITNDVIWLPSFTLFAWFWWKQERTPQD